jgi:hypothetical protein
MQTTLKRKTAGGILKTATIGKTRAGTWEIFVQHPHDCVAMLGERKDGWGETVRDVLVLTDASGCIARMSMSAKARATLASLERQCEAKYA